MCGFSFSVLDVTFAYLSIPNSILIPFLIILIMIRTPLCWSSHLINIVIVEKVIILNILLLSISSNSSSSNVIYNNENLVILFFQLSL